jgi:hypothetical protein
VPAGLRSEDHHQRWFGQHERHVREGRHRGRRHSVGRLRKGRQLKKLYVGVCLVVAVLLVGLWWGMSAPAEPSASQQHTPSPGSAAALDAGSARGKLRAANSRGGAEGRIETLAGNSQPTGYAVATSVTRSGEVTGSPDAARATGASDGARASKNEKRSDCSLSSDCPAGQGCSFNAQERLFRCVEPNCAADADCPDEEVCRVATDPTTGPAVRRCVPAGTQRIDAVCQTISAKKSELCEKGLLCVHGRCGKPCDVTATGGCGGGRVCTETPNGAGCFPTCKEGQCPIGQVCLERAGVSTCEVRIGEDCRKGGCAAGERCQQHSSLGRVTFECRQACSPFKPSSCAQGWVCGAGTGPESVCYQACNFTDRQCPKGQACWTVNEELTLLGCRREE